MHARAHARARLSCRAASEAIYKHDPAPRGRKKIRSAKMSALFFGARVPNTVINNRIIRRSRSNTSLAPVISSGLISSYYFDVRRKSAGTKQETEEGRERERERDPISRDASRDCVRETMRT